MMHCMPPMLKLGETFVVEKVGECDGSILQS